MGADNFVQFLYYVAFAKRPDNVPQLNSRQAALSRNIALAVPLAAR
jgi:hypothetical protein